MPEYLAPGVYVEETSFRAKSIEGVSTTTTGFVGPTRRGPVAHPVGRPEDETQILATPELLTSFADFQRIYGSLEDLEFGSNYCPNYLAHSVRAFFDNGGSRLYVARVYNGESTSAYAQSKDLGAGIRFVARTPGAGGRGKVKIVPHFAAATKRNMARAPEGTTLRIGSGRRATSAQLTGGAVEPFTLPRDGRLLVRLNTDATDTEISLAGNPAEATGTTSLPDAVTLQPENSVLSLVIDGVPQEVTLPEGPTSREALVNLINSRLVGACAWLTTGATANCLVIQSDVWGSASSVTVQAGGACTPLGFSGNTTVPGTGDLANVRRVTVKELATRLLAATHDELIATTNALGRLVLSTRTQGPNAHLTLRIAGVVNGPLGFDDQQESTADGSAGTTVIDYVKRGTQWIDDTGAVLVLAGVGDGDPPSSDGAQFITIGITAEDADGTAKGYEEIGLASGHPRFVGTILSPNPNRRTDQLENFLALDAKTATPAQLRAALIPSDVAWEVQLGEDKSGSGEVEPRQAHYAAGLRALAQIDEISIIAAPGESTYAEHQGIQAAVISHCERPRAYCIAVLDTARGIVISQAQTERSRIDSNHAALYYPWVVVNNPLARPADEAVPKEIELPPSGFVCGIYVRSDVTRGVSKAPANEVVHGALRYDVDVNSAQQEVLNPLGINCLRSFPGRGNRLWGARTASSDPEWKYVNIRRYFNYLERSIDVATQWAVFEPNGERLWVNVRETVSSFLVNEWRSGALLGSSTKEAFFVRCDRSTMDQNDLDNGRLICLIGVAAIKPAEFVIFRIGQKTADARS